MYQEPKLEGKTKSEIKRINKLNRELDKTYNKENIERMRFGRIEDRHQKIMNKIYAERKKISKKIDLINEKVKARCKHNYPRMHWNNLRDDASFEKYAACTNCGELLWDECI